MARCLLERRAFTGEEIVVERCDGSRRTVLAHANPIHDASGQLIGAVNVLMDITERKQIEETLRESDRRKSEFLAMLSHELRNPLAPLRNGLEIMRRTSQTGAPVEQARLMMERQLAHMARLIDDLLDLSRITIGKIELRRTRVDLIQAIQDAVETSQPLIDERRVKLSVSLPPRPAYLDADRVRLAQVFSNLLNNAARYTHPGGRIWLTVQLQGSDVVISVKDNGAGIPPEQLDAIFEMFTQVDPSSVRSGGGLGIGLSLVRGIVELHGGRVEAQSDGPGQGSEFLVRLPITLTSHARERDGPDDAVIPKGSLYRILVVDDNRDSADSLAMMLKIMGHEARTAYDGLEAITRAQEFMPDIMLLDIGLPRMNGYEVARQMRSYDWGSRVVLIAQTGWGQEEDRCRSREAGFNFHMVKPIDPNSLEKLLAGLLLTPA